MDGNVSIAETCDSSSSVTGMGDFESVSLRGDHTENRQMGELSSVVRLQELSIPSYLAKYMQYTQ